MIKIYLYTGVMLSSYVPNYDKKTLPFLHNYLLLSILKVTCIHSTSVSNFNPILNISIRYLDYHRKNIFPMWESDYKKIIEDDHDI